MTRDRQPCVVGLPARRLRSCLDTAVCGLLLAGLLLAGPGQAAAPFAVERAAPADTHLAEQRVATARTLQVLESRTADAAATLAALKEFPAVNAEIDGDEIVYKNYVNMGIAIGGPNGLVVPVIRDCDQLSFAGVEKAISDFGRRARDGALKLDDLSGGTFSITNGGVYGSLMSTPILNPPQSGILGMHKIQDRPVAIGGRVEIRPMMYLAVSYDHRIVDGKEAVSFLVRIKEGVEDPRRLLLDL